LFTKEFSVSTAPEVGQIIDFQNLPSIFNYAFLLITCLGATQHHYYGKVHRSGRAISVTAYCQLTTSLHPPLACSSRLDLSNLQDVRPLAFLKDRAGLDHQDAAAPRNLAQAWTEQNLVFDLQNSNQWTYPPRN
ncbi:hypothetical protein C1Y11_22195, partial [Pseudomonas sp. FW305-20]